jgi:hypothetical protein
MTAAAKKALPKNDRDCSVVMNAVLHVESMQRRIAYSLSMLLYLPAVYDVNMNQPNRSIGPRATIYELDRNAAGPARDGRYSLGRSEDRSHEKSNVISSRN